jgi:hypothetical protein
MIKFNNNNIITGEIKQTLKEFNLPNVKVWKEGIRLFPGSFYIKGNNLCVGVNDILSNTVSLKIIQPYIYGQNIMNITKNLVISDMIYDSYTHEYLGNYLRFYRDMKNVNLMSMYNCFSNELARNLDIEVKDNTGKTKFVFDTENDNFKIYIVPVKFFEKYTIGIECDTKIEIIAGIYDNEKLINYSLEGTGDTTLYESTYIKTVGTRINKPFLYEKLVDLGLVLTNRIYSQENNLKLFIKVPAKSTSSVVVLEGDFVKFTELHFENDEIFSSRKPSFEVCNFETGVSNISGFVYKGGNTERKYISRPQLLDFNSTLSYPFANRLIEYLFGNVITSDETIANNVSRIQKRLVQRYNEYVTDSNGNIVYLLDLNGNYVLSNGTSISISEFNSLPSSDPRKKMRTPIHRYVGMSNIITEDSLWSTRLRNVCYDAIISSNIDNIINSNKFDLIGFIDKDSEKAIGEYREVN